MNPNMQEAVSSSDTVSLLASLDPKGTPTLEAKLAFDVDEAARLLSIGSTLLKKYLRSGELRSAKFGRRRLISRTALNDFIANNETGGWN